MPIIDDEYLEKVKRKEAENIVRRIYRTIRGAEFFFELSRSKRQTERFPYTIIFKSLDWNDSTVRQVGPEAIERFLDIFTSNNNTPIADYRNLGPKRSSSASARYLVVLFRDLAGETRWHR